MGGAGCGVCVSVGFRSCVAVRVWVYWHLSEKHREGGPVCVREGWRRVLKGGAISGSA